MKKNNNEEIAKLTKEITEICGDLPTKDWLKIVNRCRKIRLQAKGIELTERVNVEMDTPSNGSQSDYILAFLQTGESITSLEALRYFGCFRLASRISDLRRRGYDIERRMVRNEKTGKSYASYSLSINNNN